MKRNHLTLGEFIIENQKDFKYSSGELSKLINSIRLAAKIVNHQVNKARLVNIVGGLGEANIQDVEQQELDVYANDIFKSALINREIVCGVASKEDEGFVNIGGLGNTNTNKFVILIDPLDGFSNIDVNASVGTIFSIYRRITPTGAPVLIDDFLQKGCRQVAAGYIIYGTSTMLVYTTGHGVNGFTLNPAIGAFYLSHPNMKFQKKNSFYSINKGNYSFFSQGVKNYIRYCQEDKGDLSYRFRYIGSLVSDFHRNMIKGGIYIYPASSKLTKESLRLLYECNPIAFLAEQAEGKASNGYTRIMNLQPKELHERVSFFCGSVEMVKKAEEFMRVHRVNLVI